MPRPGLVTLEADGWHLKIDPDRGGQILECTWRGHEILATARPGLWPSETDAGCFPLVPYSNRIRDAAFLFAERRISLAAPAFAMPHALHGLGWRQAWSAEPSGPDGVWLMHANDGQDWPWPYTARQHIRVYAGNLVITCDIENTGTDPMPAGIGLHPYFPKPPGLTLSLHADGYWSTAPQEPGLPVAWCRLDPDAGGFASKEVNRLDLDHCFTGWSRKARLDYRQSGLSIDLTASAGFANLVIYCPPGRNILCLEPVSHVNDAANLTGLDNSQALHTLAPGASLSAQLTLNAALHPPG